MTDSNFTIGFIGLGLIGGSIAKGIRRVFPNYTCHVVCFSEVEADFLHHLRNPDPVLPEGFLLFHPTYS